MGRGVFEVVAGQVERNEIPNLSGMPRLPNRSLQGPIRCSATLLENHHLPCGGIIPGGQVVEVDTVCDLLA